MHRRLALRGRNAITLLALAAACAPFDAALADVYKCVDNGRTVYQDQPCRSGGAVVPTPPAPAAGSVDAEKTRLERLRAQVAEQEQARKQRENASQIEALENETRGYDKAEQDELALLRAKQDYANYNANGAIWELEWGRQAIAKEMAAVTEKYAALRQAAREKIAQLRADATPPPERKAQ